MRKSLRPSAGEIVTKLMKDKFTDIVDLKFTARMEDSLDLIEEGRLATVGTLRIL